MSKSSRKPMRRLDSAEQANELDLTIACPAKQCRAAIGRPCAGLAPEIVHFARRLKRLLGGRR